MSELIDECQHYEHYVSNEDRYICPDKGLCAQCRDNAKWNEAGGYKELAEKCRQFCRNGHRPQGSERPC